MSSLRGGSPWLHANKAGLPCDVLGLEGMDPIVAAIPIEQEEQSLEKLEILDAWTDHLRYMHGQRLASDELAV
jgi:hypothetical protein